MSLPDHSTLELSVYRMVQNRLPFMEDTAANEELCAEFTLEMMQEMEGCFNVDEDLEEGEPTNVGNENAYMAAQRSIIADLVAYYIVMRFAIIKTAGDASDPATIPTESFLKSAKAGSVSVDFEQIDTKGGSLTLDVVTMMDMFKSTAGRKALKQGCVIDLCDACVEVKESIMDVRPASFIVSPWKSSRGHDSETIERG